MFNEYTDNGGGGFYFRSVACNRKLVDEDNRSVTKTGLPVHCYLCVAFVREEGRFVLSLPLGWMIIARLKQTIFPDGTLARSPLSYRFVPASIYEL